MRKSALCSMAVTLRNIEHSTFQNMRGVHHFFKTFTEENVMRLAHVEAEGRFNNLQTLPSSASAMQNDDLVHEVFSLLPVRYEGMITMSRVEVRAVIAPALVNRPLADGEVVPGTEEDSIFAVVFGVHR